MVDGAIGFVKVIPVDELKDAFTTLQAKHAEELEKAVEAERDRIGVAIRSALGEVHPAPNDAKDFMGDYERGVVEGGYLVKTWVMEALTPTKTDKQNSK